MRNDKTNPKQDATPPQEKDGWIFIPPLEGPLPYEAVPPDSGLNDKKQQPSLIENIDFDLADIPEKKATPQPSKPTLTGGERKRAIQKARADLNYADTNNDGRLDGDELRRITDAAQAAKQGSQAIVLQLAMRYLQDQAANKPPKGPNGEFIVQPAPFVYVVPQTEMTVADAVLVDRDFIKKSLIEALKLDDKDAEKVIRQVLPKGIEEIRLSTECLRDESLMCEPAPLGNVRYSIAPRERT